MIAGIGSTLALASVAIVYVMKSDWILMTATWLAKCLDCRYRIYRSGKIAVEGFGYRHACKVNHKIEIFDPSGLQVGYVDARMTVSDDGKPPF